MPTRQAPRVSPGCCRHQVTSRPQPTHLPPPPTEGPPYTLCPGIFQKRLASVPPNRSNCQSCVPRGRKGLHQLSIADVHFTAGEGRWLPQVWGFSPLLLPCKKNNTQKPGQLLKSAQWSAPEGGRDREAERHRETETGER